jgi:hypothetical protein
VKTGARRPRGVSWGGHLALMIATLPAAAALTAVPARAQETAEPLECPAVEARIDMDASSVATMVPVPGRLISYAVARQEDGRRQLLMLIAPREQDDASAAVRAQLRALRSSGDLEETFAGSERVKIDLSDPDAVDRFLAELDPRLGTGEAGGVSCPQMEDVPSITLFRLAEGESPELVPLLDDLPEESSAIVALDLDGDGIDEILLEQGRTLYRLPMAAPAAGVNPAAGETREGPPGTEQSSATGTSPAGGKLLPLFADPDLRLRAEEPREVDFPPEPVAVRSPLDDLDDVSMRDDRSGSLRAFLPGHLDPLHLRVTGNGTLKLYGPAEGASTWGLRSQVELPTRSNPYPGMLLLTTPQVRTIGRTEDGHLLLGAGPIPYGDQRLRTILIQVDDLDVPQVLDVWSRVPRGEFVDRSGYLMLDGQPHLWVATDNNEEVVIFGSNEALRFFRLTPDRTRAGGMPVVAFEKIKEFQETRLIYGQDLNGDGRDDLLFIADDEDELLLTAYLQKKDGRFGSSFVRQSIEENATPRAYGEDLDGDGLPDLLASDRTSVWIHSGVASQVNGKTLTLVSDHPTWRAGRRRATDGRPELVRCDARTATLADLDGDGRTEWLCAGDDKHGRPYFKVIRFTRAL